MCFNFQNSNFGFSHSLCKPIHALSLHTAKFLGNSNNNENNKDDKNDIVRFISGSDDTTAKIFELKVCNEKQFSGKENRHYNFYSDQISIKEIQEFTGHVSCVRSIGATGKKKKKKKNKD